MYILDKIKITSTGAQKHAAMFDINFYVIILHGNLCYPSSEQVPVQLFCYHFQLHFFSFSQNMVHSFTLDAHNCMFVLTVTFFK